MSPAAATLLLVRHASTEAVGQWLAGRQDVELNADGRAEAETLASLLSRTRAARLYSSPRSRALATAVTIGRPHGLEPVIVPGLDEVDFGEWTGRRFDVLADDPAWRAFNRERQLAIAPGGEPMRDVVERARRFLDNVRTSHAGDLVVAVTHADVIRCAMVALIGINLDAVARLQISPARVTVTRLWPEWAEVVSVNTSPEIADLA